MSTSDAEAQHRDTRWQTRVALALFVAFFWLAAFEWPGGMPSAERESSWHQALDAAFLRQLEFGDGLVFTWGPLGFLATSAFHAETVVWKLVLWQGLFKALALLLATRALLRLGALERVALVLALCLHPLGTDATVLFAILAALDWALADGPRQNARALALGGGYALLALMKVSWWGALGACGGAFVWSAWRDARGAALRFAAAGLGAFAATWWALGQSFTELPNWLANSARIAAGYSTAMSLDGRPLVTQLAVVAVVLGAAALVLRGASSPRSRREFAFACAAAACLFVAAKAGLVRRTSHPVTLFGYVALAVLLAGPALPRAAWRASATLLRLAAAGVMIAGTSLTLRMRATDFVPAQLHETVVHALANAGELAAPAQVLAARTRERENACAEVALPRVRALVRDADVDLVPASQGVLLANGLAWTPRPVLQSYCTFDARLQALDADFYARERAPAFVLFQAETIDWRLPNMDDAPAIVELARRYEPALAEQGWLAWRRRPGALAEVAPRLVLERELAFGETFDWPATDERGAGLLALDVESTLAGRAWSTLSRAAPLYLEVWTDDGDYQKTRIVPEMMRTGVLVSPWLTTTSRWLQWYDGARPVRPLRMRLAPPLAPAAVGERVRVRVLHVADAGPRAEPAAERDPPFEIASVRPLAFDPRARATEFSAPGELRWVLSPGAHEVSLAVRVPPADGPASSARPVAAALVLRAEVRDAAGARDLFEERFALGSADVWRIERRFATIAPARLEVHLVVEPAGASCDGLAWESWRVR